MEFIQNLKFPLAAAAKSHQLCLTPCDPLDGSPPGPPVPGILQARILEWVVISFSNAWKWNAKGKLLSRVRFFATAWTVAHQAPPSMGFSREGYWSGVPLPSQLHLSLDLICFSLMTDGVEPLACFPSAPLLWWRVCSDLLPIFPVRLFVSLLLISGSPVYILDKSRLSHVSCECFSQCVACFLCFRQNLLKIKRCLRFLSPMTCDFRVLWTQPSPDPESQILSYAFF